MNGDAQGYRPDAITASEWRQIVQSATDTAIISTNRSGQVTSWNEGARRLLGWNEEEMLGQTLERLFDDPQQITREIHDAASLDSAAGRKAGDERRMVSGSGGRAK